MIIALIAAIAENDVIGRDNALPWHLPDEYRYFRRVTEGHWVIMGRRTWESRAIPLAKRVNVVVTTQADYRAEGVLVVDSLRAGLDLAMAAGEREAFVIGGTRLYAEALEFADRLYLTRVHGEFEGDAYFPPVDWAIWNEVRRERHEADEKHAVAFTMQVFDRSVL
jgi:dihydrofolate reductase